MDMPTVPSEDELNQLLKRTFTSSLRSDYIAVEGYILPERYREFEKSIKEYEVFDTDLWITGFPKTGTTWISEIAWLILNDFDYEGAKVVEFMRVRMMEFSMLFDANKDELFGGWEIEHDSIAVSRNQKHPRSIKTHLPFPLLPEQIRNGTRKPRIIYTARNPMDTCVSYYHQVKNYENYTGTFEEFCTLFLYDKANYGPFSKHVISFWEQRSMPNLLFLTYEEIQKDLAGVIRKVAKLLGKPISREDSIKLQEYVSFDSMKKNPAVNRENIIKDFEMRTGDKITPFIRKGKAGGYKDTLSPEMIAQFEYWMRKRFKGTSLNLLDD